MVTKFFKLYSFLLSKQYIKNIYFLSYFLFEHFSSFDLDIFLSVLPHILFWEVNNRFFFFWFILSLFYPSRGILIFTDL